MKKRFSIITDLEQEKFKLNVFRIANVENVIDTLENAFAKDGRPSVIVTDNGFQFCPRVEGQNHVFETFLPSIEYPHRMKANQSQIITIRFNLILNPFRRI